jgi:hypothetical protein
MTAGGRVPAAEAGPVHVHQGDEVPRVLSGQILIRCRDRRAPPASCVGHLCQAIPNAPVWAAAASRQVGVMPAQIRRSGFAAWPRGSRCVARIRRAEREQLAVLPTGGQRKPSAIPRDPPG